LIVEIKETQSTTAASEPKSEALCQPASRAAMSAIEFSHWSVSRFQWVMNFDAFQANRKSGGVSLRQERTAYSDGVR
jgi:hypothetical protein